MLECSVDDNMFFSYRDLKTGCTVRERSIKEKIAWPAPWSLVDETHTKLRPLVNQLFGASTTKSSHRTLTPSWVTTPVREQTCG